MNSWRPGQTSAATRGRVESPAGRWCDGCARRAGQLASPSAAAICGGSCLRSLCKLTTATLRSEPSVGRPQLTSHGARIAASFFNNRPEEVEVPHSRPHPLRRVRPFSVGGDQGDRGLRLHRFEPLETPASQPGEHENAGRPRNRQLHQEFTLSSGGHRNTLPITSPPSRFTDPATPHPP